MGACHFLGPKLNLKRRRQARQLRQQGLSLAAIGERLGGISRQAVHHLLNRDSRARRADEVCGRCCNAYITTIRGGSRRSRSALCRGCLVAIPEVAFAERLKTFRLAAGLTRQDLARRAQLSRDVVHIYERGSSTPCWHVLVALMQVLGTKLASLGINKKLTPQGLPRAALGERQAGGPLPSDRLARWVTVCCRCCDTPITTMRGGSKRSRSALCLRCLAEIPPLGFAERLKAFRLAAGLTRAQLGEQTGFSQEHLSAYESSIHQPGWEALVRLMQVLGPGLATLGIKKQG
jgi:transcriptional regulator with XRE-family HTH domain